MSARRLLVIGAHSADFVWRAAGVMALVTRAGGAARALARSYGERGESGELWKEPGQTVERVKEVRHGEAERAAAVLGADFHCLDLGDYPLEIDRVALERLADAIREFALDAIVTHTDRDPFNPDHGVTGRAVERARSLAAAFLPSVRRCGSVSMSQPTRSHRLPGGGPGLIRLRGAGFLLGDPTKPASWGPLLLHRRVPSGAGSYLGSTGPSATDGELE